MLATSRILAATTRFAAIVIEDSGKKGLCDEKPHLRDGGCRSLSLGHAREYYFLPCSSV
jgi:hypothetical protein